MLLQRVSTNRVPPKLAQHFVTQQKHFYKLLKKTIVPFFFFRYISLNSTITLSRDRNAKLDSILKMCIE